MNIPKNGDLISTVSKYNGLLCLLLSKGDGNVDEKVTIYTKGAGACQAVLEIQKIFKDTQDITTTWMGEGAGLLILNSADFFTQLMAYKPEAVREVVRGFFGDAKGIRVTEQPHAEGMYGGLYYTDEHPNAATFFYELLTRDASDKASRRLVHGIVQTIKEKIQKGEQILLERGMEYEC